MKIVAKPLEMIAVFKCNGEMEPFKFKYKDKAIKIDRVCEKRLEKFAGTPQEVFRCQSIVDNLQVVYEVKYDVLNHKWILWKI